MMAVSGRELPGVIAFRDLNDVNIMLAAAKEGGRAVVVRT
jgi:nitrite reductase (NADH) large subunit